MRLLSRRRERTHEDNEIIIHKTFLFQPSVLCLFRLEEVLITTEPSSSLPGGLVLDRRPRFLPSLSLRAS